ncbi:hypothetical protein J1614_004320 [Plenodomus biglobosus]|nr:hypothetical protein J1614_004320 [Plenodomus biglobosus]
MSTPFRLRPARLADLNSVAKVWTAAFFDDEIIGDLMHPNRRQYPDDLYWFLLRGIREHFWNWRNHLVIATIVTTDEQGHSNEGIAGAADWRRLGDGGATRELARVDPSTFVNLRFDYMVHLTMDAI